MQRKGKAICCAVIGWSVIAGASRAEEPVGTAFSYQGFLEKPAGTPLNDTCSFDLALCDHPTDACVPGTVSSHPGIEVTDGVFTVPDVDFGPGAIKGTGRWMIVSVQCTGDATPVELSPRVELKPAPHALALPGLYTQENATSPNVIGGFSGNSVNAGTAGATIGGGGVTGAVNRVTANFGTVGGGARNTVSGLLSTVGGGETNTASQERSTVGGGEDNTASGQHSTVGGGDNNTASGAASTVSGGKFNTASGSQSTIGGGVLNTASGQNSTVGGGWLNTAGGDLSFAAGFRAKANHDGAFVWGDSTSADFTSTGPDQFLIRAAGGVGIGKNDPAEQLDVQGNIHASGTIASGSSITIDGTTGSERMTSSNDLELHVATGRALRIESNATSPNVIGGFSGNSVNAGTAGATIGGGGLTGAVNRVTANFGTVGGGLRNTASGLRAVVGGGFVNTASGTTSTVGGGEDNTASGQDSTVGGGDNNTASGATSAVSGGNFNTASGDASTVGGGSSNSAGGNFSFAAGFRANANHDGAFVWGDSTSADFTSTGPDQFLIRAAGGVGINKNNPVAGSLDVAGPGLFSGNVGIGTDSPSAKLHVSGGAGPVNMLIEADTDNSGESDQPSLTLSQDGGIVTARVGFFDASNHLSIRAADSGGGLLHVLLEPGGNVGIKRNTPAHPLHVGTDTTNGNGAHVTAGGVWTNGSDRNSKQSHEQLDKREILRKVAELPITRWQYKGEPENVRHIGPVAQDFYAAFATGADDRYIGTIDADGVALAAIQGLYEIVQEKECEIAELTERDQFKDRRIGELEKRNMDLEARLARVEAHLSSTLTDGERQ